LDRLARRGVPVGVAAGAAVLGIASGTAAVPNSVCLTALAAAKDPAAVSPVVLSLARGVTSMSLTRTKLLAIAVLAAGALTTGVGSRLLSTADAQAPPANPETQADQMNRAIDYLRSIQGMDRWEYKFIPVEKALTTADLQKVLSTADREGWTYLGSQDLVASDKRAAVPHMVFKRPRAGARAADESNAAAGLYALAVAQQQKAAQDAAAAEAAALKKAEAQEKANAVSFPDKTLRSAMEAEMAKSIYAERIQTAQAALARERDRSAALERMVNELRSEHEDLVRRLRALEGEKEANRRSALDSGAGMADLVLPLKHADAVTAARALEKMVADGLIKTRVDDRSNSLILLGSPDALDKARGVIAKVIDVPTGPNARLQGTVTAQIPLSNVDGQTAAKDLARLMPGAQIIAEVRPDHIVLKGPADVIDAARQQLQKQIDVKPAGRAVTDDKPQTTMIRLKETNAAEVQALLTKVYEQKGKFEAHTATNSIVIAAPPAVLAEVKKLIEALDVPRGKR
jgi:type II secretory pathway component GspD/PulD (secretin)